MHRPAWKEHSRKCLLMEVRLALVDPSNRLREKARTQMARLGGVRFCDGRRVHKAKLPQGAECRCRLPCPGRRAAMRPESMVAPAQRFAQGPEGRVGLPFAPRSGPCCGRGGQASARY